MEPTLDDLIHKALKNGREVKLVLCPEYGYDFEIDGERLMKFDRGMPRETFGFPFHFLASEGRERAENLLEELEAEGDTVD